MRRSLSYLGLPILVVLVSACLAQRASAPEMRVMEEPPPVPTAVAARAVDSENAPDSGGGSPDEGSWGAVSTLPQDAGTQEQRVIIYSGSIALVVKDAGQAASDIATLAVRQGGYVSGANLYMQNDVKRGTMTIRIPAEKYEETVAALRELGVRVEKETTSTDDVTQEYTDLQARKTNLEHTEQALQKLLDERLKVGRTQDILEVYREMSNVRGEIEQIEGRLRYLSNLAALSTISVELIPGVLYQPVAVAGWEPQGIAKQALQALIGTLQVLATVLIYVGILVIPILIVILIPIVVLVLLIRWLIRRRRAKKAASGQSTSPR
jgi:RNA polymerase-interacting CarD/CdnL/TRCF family regulator